MMLFPLVVRLNQIGSPQQSLGKHVTIHAMQNNVDPDVAPTCQCRRCKRFLPSPHSAGY